jgi:hypothetical protein
MLANFTSVSHLYLEGSFLCYNNGDVRGMIGDWSAKEGRTAAALSTSTLEIQEWGNEIYLALLLPWLAGPELHTLGVTTRYNLAEAVRSTTSTRAKTLTNLALNLLYYYSSPEWNEAPRNKSKPRM